jgi:hypothetical protein
MEPPQAFFFQNLVKTSPAGFELPAHPATARRRATASKERGPHSPSRLKGGRAALLGVLASGSRRMLRDYCRWAPFRASFRSWIVPSPSSSNGGSAEALSLTKVESGLLEGGSRQRTEAPTGKSLVPGQPFRTDALGSFSSGFHIGSPCRFGAELRGSATDRNGTSPARDAGAGQAAGLSGSLRRGTTVLRRN